MPNSLLTIDMITREAVMLFRNTNAFIQNIDMQYDNQFARDGAKIGDSLRIRLPNDYVVRDGPAMQIQDTVEPSTTLTVATQRGVDVSFTSDDLTLDLDDFSTRILSPMINNLAGDVAAAVMAGTEGGISNIVTNVNGGGAIITPTLDTWALAGAALDNNSAPRGNRKGFTSPNSNARAVTAFSGLFNPQGQVSDQFKSGQVSSTALGFDWYMDQTVLIHTTGSFSAGTVNGAGQTGLTLTVNAITGTLALGDIITIAGVNAVNRVTKETTGSLRQFVVTAAALNGATSLSIYPAIVPLDGGGNKQQYQTVVASPANAAAISLVTPASGSYIKNFICRPEAVTMATADLWIPNGGVIEASRHVFDGVSMRMISDYLTSTDQRATRLDVLFGFEYVRPEWAVIVADQV